MNDQDQSRLDGLAQRIAAAKHDDKRLEAGDTVEAEDQSQGRNIGFDLIATILGSMLIGWLIDRSFGTGHWGLFIMIPVGFIVAMFQVWRSLNNNSDTPDKKL